MGFRCTIFYRSAYDLSMLSISHAAHLFSSLISTLIYDDDPIAIARNQIVEFYAISTINKPPSHVHNFTLA